MRTAQQDRQAADQAKLSTIERFHVRFAPCSRLAEREFELHPGLVSGNRLKAKLNWNGVPNGRGEQLERKPGVRERFGACGPSPRCTAIHEKRPNSWATATLSAGRETVRIGNVGGGRRTVVKPSTLYFQLVMKHTDSGGCRLENPEAVLAALHCCNGCYPASRGAAAAFL
jgi:hypothetical protein